MNCFGRDSAEDVAEDLSNAEDAEELLPEELPPESREAMAPRPLRSELHVRVVGHMGTDTPICI